MGIQWIISFDHRNPESNCHLNRLRLRQFNRESASIVAYELTCTIIFCFGKTKYVLVLTSQKIIPKQNIFGFVSVLSKQKIIVQVSL